MLFRNHALAVGWFLLGATHALAVCPALQTDCPSPTYNVVTAASLQTNGTSAAALTVDLASVTGHLNGVLSGAQIFQNLVHQPSSFNADGVRGVATAEPGTTVTNTNGIAGYVFNQVANAGSGGPNSVSIYGVGISAVDNAETWGINTNLTDDFNVGVPTGSGRKLLNEFDFNVNKTSTQINGLVLQGSSAVQPSSANGFVVSPLRLGFFDRVWNNSFISTNGAANVALYVGTLGDPATANLGSQQIAFIYTDGSSVQQPVFISASAAGVNIGGAGAIAKTVVLTPTTFASLPACGAGTSGSMASITNGTALTYGSTAAGGGSVHTPVFCNGTNWIVH